MTDDFIKREIWRQRKRHRYNGGRNCSNVAINRGMSRTGGNFQSQRQEVFSPTNIQREPDPADTMTLDFWPPEL